MFCDFNRWSGEPCRAWKKTDRLLHGPSRGELRVLPGLLRADALQCLLIVALSDQQPAGPGWLDSCLGRIGVHAGYIGWSFQGKQGNRRRTAARLGNARAAPRRSVPRQ
jgi:hypothetical protein